MFFLIILHKDGGGVKGILAMDEGAAKGKDHQ
jgi:hypothetical protein